MTENIKYITQPDNTILEVAQDKTETLAIGEKKTDSTLVAQMNEFAHSTFDLSKFTVAGSPTITDDGIASEFGYSNYINTISVDLTQNKPFKIISPLATINNLYSSEKFICGCSNVKMIFGYTNYLGWRYTLSQSSSETAKYYIAMTAGHTYQLSFEYTGTKYIGAYRDITANIDWTTCFEVTSSDYIDNSSQPIIQVGGPNAGYVLTTGQGSLDLKQFSIKVDGVPVFSGNKTGIDTIKADNYTVVGSPTITNDGIASGFSSSNYITTSTLDFSNPWTFTFEESVASTMAGAYGVNAFNVQPQTTNGVYFIVPGSGALYAAYNYAVETKVMYRVSWDGTTYKLEMKGDTVKTSWQTIKTYTSSTALTGTSLNLGYNRNALNASLGSYDLNKCTFTSNGNLVYQPCLKIPYTETKTSSKVVDSYYKDRVLDVKEQFGKAEYYVYQDHKEGNYTVVGSPTISDDFVASGFSSSNDILCNYSFNPQSSWNVKGTFILTSLPTTNTFVTIFTTNTTYGSRLRVNSSAKLAFNLSSNNTSYDIANEATGKTVLSLNTTYYYDFSFDVSQYVLKLSTDGINWTTEKTITSSSIIYTTSSTQIRIGKASSSYEIFTGSIDLKQFKIYVDDSLVYEAVTPENYTLPYGDVYGFIGTSGASKLVDLTDVSITSPTQGQNLTYDATNQVWKNTSSSAQVAWGGITGTLSDQSDLQDALDAKANDSAIVHLAGTETISGTKTFTGSPVFQGTSYDNAVTIKNTGSGNSPAITFYNGTDFNGLIGFQANTANPCIWDSSYNRKNLLTNSNGGQATGSTSLPVYIDANGVAQPITSYSGNALTQDITPVSASAITLDNTKGIYSKTISANTTFTFDVSGLGTLTNKAVTFELYLTMNTVYTLTFPGSVTWISEPDFTSTGKYLLVFKSMDGGTSWVGNLEFQV